MGRRDNYAIDKRPLGRGGYAEVFRARRKSDGVFVAFKKSRPPYDRALISRLGREVAALRRLAGHANIVELLDWNLREHWYTMPLAQGTLAALRSELTLRGVRKAVEDAARGLGYAHELGFIHRDVTPRNILCVAGEADDRRWVVADWGLVKGPATTAQTKLTQGPLGTEGFLAPELANPDAPIDQRADIYGLGRVAAWAVTGTWPSHHGELFPDGPWRLIVKRCTARDPAARPENMVEVLELLRTTDPLAPPAPSLPELLTGDAQRGGADLLAAVTRIVEGEYEARQYADWCLAIADSGIHCLVLEAPAGAIGLAQRIATYVENDWRRLGHDSVGRHLYWIQRVAEESVRQRVLGLFSDLCEVWFEVQAGLDPWAQADRSREFLRRLSGDAADAAARVLLVNPKSAAHFRKRGVWDAADPRIRRALGF